MRRFIPRDLCKSGSNGFAAKFIALTTSAMCHSERSEESSFSEILSALGGFHSLRMTIVQGFSGVSLKLIILLAVVILLPTSIQAERRPGRLFPPEKINILEEPREWQRPEEVLAWLELKEGDVVADIGAGAGYFAILFAPTVGAKGLVYAEEIQKEMVDYMEKKINSLGVQNVEVVLGKPTDPGLPEGSLDLAFLGNVYHEVEKPIELLKNISRELKLEGRLAIIDWDPYRESPIGPPREERVPEHEVIEEVQKVGFRLYERHALPYQYFLIFKKR